MSGSTRDTIRNEQSLDPASEFYMDRLLEHYDDLLRVLETPVEPHTLQIAGLFGVLTRIQEPDGGQVSAVQKAKAYNGEIDEADDIDVKKLREEAQEVADLGEGMDGVSPRFIGNEIAEAIMDSIHRGRDFLSPLTTFNHLEENLENYGSIPQGNFETYYRYLELVREEYRERAIEDVRHALAYDLDEVLDRLDPEDPRVDAEALERADAGAGDVERYPWKMLTYEGLRERHYSLVKP